MSQLTEEGLVKVVLFLSHLLEADNMIRLWIQGIINQVFALVAQLTDASEGLVASTSASLTNILNLVPSCSGCPSLQQ